MVTGIDDRKLLQLHRESIALHTRFVHGYWLKPHHREWARALGNDAIKRLLIIAPPKYGKTPVVGLDYAGWRIGNNPSHHILYVSNTAGQANKVSVALRDTIARNLRYRELYGLAPDVGKGWGESQWFVKRPNDADKDPTFEALGMHGPGLGATVEEVVFDDVADPENMATAYQRYKAIEWIKTVPMSRLLPTIGRAIMICTRWHEEDPAAKFEMDGWTAIHLPAITAEGELTYPGFWTHEALLQRQIDEGPRMFALMFQGEVLPEGGSIFKHEWWRYWDEEENYPKANMIIQVWDTAFKEKQTSDYSASETWAISNEGYYLIDAWRGKVEFPDLKRAVLDVYEQHHPSAVLIEDAASGQCYSSDTEILTKRGWLRFPDVDINSDAFATRNMDSREFEWQKATARCDEFYSGQMVHFHSRSIDLLVTPEHRMLVTSLPRKLGGNCHRKGDVIVEANQLVGYKPGSHMSIPMVSVWHGVEIGNKIFHADKTAMAKRYGKRFDTLGRKISSREIKPIAMTGDEYCAFMGMYLAEGWHRIDFTNRMYGVFISQRKQDTEAFKSFQAVLSSITKREIHYDNDGFVICSLGLAEYVAQFGSNAYNKYIPAEIMNTSPRQLRIFWDYYVFGDGSRYRGEITTVSPCIAGQLVEIAQKMGFSASTYKEKKRLKSVIIGHSKVSTPPENFRQAYKISLRKSCAMSFYADEGYYTGMIHCVSVPNGIVYVRRNGKPAWCGQSLIQEIKTHTRIPVIAIKVDKDKVARAHAVTGLCESGKVKLPKKAAWRYEWEKEHEVFPGGAHDDWVDTTTMALNWARFNVVQETVSLTSVPQSSRWKV